MVLWGDIYRCGDPNTQWAIPVHTVLNIYFSFTMYEQFFVHSCNFCGNLCLVEYIINQILLIGLRGDIHRCGDSHPCSYCIEYLLSFIMYEQSFVLSCTFHFIHEQCVQFLLLNVLKNFKNLKKYSFHIFCLYCIGYFSFNSSCMSSH